MRFLPTMEYKIIALFQNKTKQNKTKNKKEGH